MVLQLAASWVYSGVVERVYSMAALKVAWWGDLLVEQMAEQMAASSDVYLVGPWEACWDENLVGPRVLHSAATREQKLASQWGAATVQQWDSM